MVKNLVVYVNKFQQYLQDLITQSRQLKVTVDGPERLLSILSDVNRWEDCAHALLEHSKALLYIHNSDITIDGLFSVEVEELLVKFDCAIETGLSFGLDLSEVPKLRHASLILRWSLGALSCCSRIPSYEVIIFYYQNKIFSFDLLFHKISAYKISLC